MSIYDTVSFVYDSVLPPAGNLGEVVAALDIEMELAPGQLRPVFLPEAIQSMYSGSLQKVRT